MSIAEREIETRRLAPRSWHGLSDAVVRTTHDLTPLLELLERLCGEIGADWGCLVVNVRGRACAIESRDRAITAPLLEATHGVAAGAAPASAELGPRLVLALRAGAIRVGALGLESADRRHEFSAAELESASAFAEHLALALDGHLARQELNDKIVEGNLVREQLEAYAHDVRDSYAAERARSDELATALDELAQTYLATVQGLAIAVEAKDECTGGHLVRVTKYGLALAEAVAPELLDSKQLEYGFLLHDIGKLTIPDAILGKAGPLTQIEWGIMRQHSMAGYRILDGIPFLAEAKQIVMCHHERWDGTGYPSRLRGDDIPLGSRLFPLADAFDAMTSNRPYRDAISIPAALDELRAGSGTQFWPDAVTAFCDLDPSVLGAIQADDATIGATA